MSLYLQSNELNEDVWWIIGALIVLGIVFYLTKKFQYTQKAKHVQTNDPRQNVVNDSSYNPAQEGIDGHRDQGLSAEEATKAANQMRDEGHIPSDDEFFELKKDMKKGK